MKKIEQSKWRCWRCDTVRTIKTEDLIFLQLGDRMASGLFIYCDSPVCNGFVIQVPITNWSKALYARRYEIFKRNGSTDEYFKKDK